MEVRENEERDFNNKRNSLGSEVWRGGKEEMENTPLQK